MDQGAYFVGGNACNPPCPNVRGSSRGIRGSMDRLVEDVGNGENASPSPTHPKKHCNQVCMDIRRLFFENGIPFNAATSPSFANTIRSIGNYGRGLKPPMIYKLRTWILKEEVKTTDGIVNDIKATWKETGVSLLSDGWSDMRNRSLINFLVNNRHGTVFLKTIDVSDCVKNAQKLFELLDQVIKEIGENIVVQVVTDNASLGNFIHNHQWVLSLTRKFCKKDLRPAATRFATAFLTLESMFELKQGLQTMFITNEWSICAWENKPEGKAIKKIVMDDRNFWPSVVYSIKTTKPLVHVLRIVDGETPAMGFIYGAMDEVKERIAKNLDDDVSSSKEIWGIINAKWDHQLHRDLHASGYFLNPRFRWSNDSSNHPEITRGLFACMESLVKNDVIYSKLEEQINEYKNKRGLFSLKGSLTSYKTHSPNPRFRWSNDYSNHPEITRGLFACMKSLVKNDVMYSKIEEQINEYKNKRDTYGVEVPELRLFAMKILGITISSSACERNWSTFNQVHTKRRNHLTTDRMNSLVYIMYNNKLKQRFQKKKTLKDEEDPLSVEDISSDDEWVANPNDDENGDEINRGEGESSRSRKRRSVLVDLDDEEDEEDDYRVNYGSFSMDNAYTSTTSRLTPHVLVKKRLEARFHFMVLLDGELKYESNGSFGSEIGAKTKKLWPKKSSSFCELSELLLEVSSRQRASLHASESNLRRASQVWLISGVGYWSSFTPRD
ncbi:hypothetical protein OSB04_029327 [Centaurea solstitialis]|uniref:Uncharacterized protein n=1 Tax=Centaurea solstitialis TaxID=347529 RepID=A0AA38SVT1_9ASTR|nr:hypothetical protein OSB04_029327 [Centaurea solstitialis]